MSLIFLIIAKFAIIFSGVLIKDLNAAPVKNSTEPCIIVADITNVSLKAFSECKKELKLSSSEIPSEGSSSDAYEEYYERIANNGFDDKCFMKCAFDKINLFKNGKLDFKVLEKLYQGGNMTEPFKTHILEHWHSCDQESDESINGVGEKKLCLKAARIENCWFKKAKSNAIEKPC